MKLKLLKGAFFSIVLISITLGTYYLLISVFSIEIDATSIATYIVDGDTFDISSGDRIRLADVDTPERGEAGFDEASNFLRSRIYNRRVYLDIDDIYIYDTYGSRLVCLVYVDYNSTHFLNVNKALLVRDYAHISDYDNEFSPYEWTLFVPKPGTDMKLKFLGISTLIGFGSTLVLYVILKKIWSLLSSGFSRVKRLLSF